MGEVLAVRGVLGRIDFVFPLGGIERRCDRHRFPLVGGIGHSIIDIDFLVLMTDGALRK